jgi:hypothetical protein
MLPIRHFNIQPGLGDRTAMEIDVVHDALLITEMGIVFFAVISQAPGVEF